MQRSGETDPEQGLFRGRVVARRFVSPDGLTILVGKSAADNDVVTFKLATPHDFWLHVAADSGSHVVVLNPQGLERMPRDTQQMAAGLAAGYSKVKGGGRVAVHVTRREEIGKERGMAPGKVSLRRFKTVQAKPRRE